VRRLSPVDGVPATPQLSRRLLGRPLVRDLLVVVGWFVLVGVVGAVLWWQLTPLAEYTRTAATAQMDEEQLGRQVSADGWYFVIAAVGGVLSGIVLLSWRRRDPVTMVVLVTLGALLAAWLMLRIGLWLGPANPNDVLPHVAVGAQVPLQLRTHASGVVFVWPVTALLGAIGVIWGTDSRPGKVLDDPLSVERSR
jgi:CHASE2 domain-containing sensor protein